MITLVHAVFDEVLAPAEARALRGPGAVRPKGDGTRVTDADLEVEALLVAGLARVLPGDGVRGEEGAATPGAAWWALDPVDGTENYLRGGPDWAVAICRVVDGSPSISLISFPAHRERWWAGAGAGAWRGGARLPWRGPGGAGALPEQPSWDPVADPRPFLLPASVLRHLPAAWPGPAVAPRCTTRSLARVAAGEAAAALVGPGWQPWDLLPGLLLLHEVGLGAWGLDGARLSLAAAAAGEDLGPLVLGDPAAASALAAAIRAV